MGAVGGAIGGTRARVRRSEPAWAASAPYGRPGWAEQEQQQQASYAAQQQGALAHGRANYNQAFGACMTGRWLFGELSLRWPLDFSPGGTP